MSLQEILDRVVLDNTVGQWALAVGYAVAATLALGFAKGFVLGRLAKWAERTETDLDDLLIDLVRRIHRVFLLVLGLWLGARILTLGGKTHWILDHVVHLNFYVQGGLWAVGLVDYGIRKLLVRGKDAADPARAMGSSILGLIGRLLVWSTVGLLALANVLDQDVSVLLTGMGVGGIAVALALQNVLGDLFASITILLDKPFVTGDAITVGDFTGTVEHIGIKTTRLKSVNGEQIIMGNSDLVNSRIRNFKRLDERRGLFTIGVTYQTPQQVVERIPGMLKEIVDATPDVRFDRAHFRNFADSALVFETAYFVLKPDYQTFMDAQQAINLALLKRFQRERIEFAYPTQMVLHAPLQASLPQAGVSGGASA